MQKLDDVDRKILDILIDNTRTPFTDIAKRLLISPGTVHVRVKKMEDLGIIKGSSLTLDYKMLGYNFIAYVGVLIDRSRRTYEIIEELKDIAKPTLDSLAIYLQEQPSYKLSIGGHTDNTGKESANQSLSENRAKAVKAYLVKKGVLQEELKPLREVIQVDRNDAAAAFGEALPSGLRLD